MTDQASQHLRRLGWSLAMVVILALVAINVLSARQLPALRAEVAATNKKMAWANATIARHPQDVKRLNRLRTAVKSASYGPSRRGAPELDDMLKACTSRDDFLVREGPKFVWSELSSSTEHTKKIGFYAPAGRHSFKYAIRGAEQRGHQTPFTYGDARTIKNAVGVELHDAPQVYEIELKHDQRGTLRITLLGAENETIHENTLALIDAPCRLGLGLRAESPAFPSELKNNFRAKRYFEEGRSTPVTELGSMFIKEDRPKLPRKTAWLRLWIESDAPACMSAVQVVTDYQNVTLLRNGRYPQTRGGLSHREQQDQEFNRLFHPYNGSGRFNFRAGIFATPRAGE